MLKRLAPLTALCALLVTLAAGGGSSAAGGLPRCATGGLDVWLNTNGNGAAGSTYYELELTNLSKGTCSLRGYPGVSAVNLSGRQLGSPAAREAAKSVGAVTLAPSQTATVQLRIVDAGNFPSSSCHEVTAAGLRVYPPGQTTSRIVPYPFQACSRTGHVDLSVGPAF